MSIDHDGAPRRRRRLLSGATGRPVRAFAAIAGAALLVLVSACSNSSSGSSSKDIQLGISVPLSGAVGSSCSLMNKAMLAWFDHVNASGGVNGKQIKVDNRDDGYDAARSVTNTKAFVAEHVTAVTGQCGSLQPPAQLPLLTSAKIPFLFTFGASTSLLKPLSPEYFNLMPTYGDQLAEEVPWVFGKYGAGSVAIVNTTTPDSDTTNKQVQQAVNKAGGHVVASYSVPPGTADFSPYVLKMKPLHPDYVVIDQIPQDAARLTKQMVSSQFAPNKYLIGSNAVSQGTFLSTVDKSIAPKLIVTSDTIVPSAATNTQCASVIKAAKLDLEDVTLRGCGTAQVVVKALQQDKDGTSAGLISALESWKNVNASEVYQPLNFSKSNHVGVSGLYVFGVKNGDFAQIGEIH